MEMDSDSEEEMGEIQGEGDDGMKINELQNGNSINTQSSKQHAAYEVTQPAPAAPQASNVVIRDYDPKKGSFFLSFLIFNFL